MKRFISLALVLMFSVCLLCGLTVNASALDKAYERVLIVEDLSGHELHNIKKVDLMQSTLPQDFRVYVTDTGLTWYDQTLEFDNFVKCSVDGVYYFPGDVIEFPQNYSDTSLTIIVDAADELDLGILGQFIPYLEQHIGGLHLGTIVQSIFSVVEKIKDFFSSDTGLWQLFENSSSMFQGLQNFWSFLGSMMEALPAPIITVMVFVFSTPLIIGFFKMF